MTTEVELTLEYKDSNDFVDIDFLTDDDTLDDITSFNLYTEHSELTEVLDYAIEQFIFSEDHSTIDKLQEILDNLRKFDTEGIMQLLAYNAEYTLSTISEIEDISFDSIYVLNYESPADYIKELTLENNPELINLSMFIDWEGYADWKGEPWQTLSLDGENFIYQLR